MKHHKIPLLFDALFCISTVTSQAQETNHATNPVPDAGSSDVRGDYYSDVYKLSGVALRSALHNLIKNHTVVTYASLWTHFYTTDRKSNDKVWDIYSDVLNGAPAYEYTFFTDQCGNYAGEGDCYNREHSWPQSWFGSQMIPSSDIFHIYPTDGYVNNRRGNYPFGVVNAPVWTSTNGSKLGTNAYPGYVGTVFEPIDAYKGDLARSQFYMSVRYYGEDTLWSTSPATNRSDLLTWYANMLYDWHMADTVSVKELDRNTVIYGIQNNRNPFIDHPEFAAEIWNTSMPPSVVSVRAVDSTTLLLDFSRYIDSISATNPANFTLNDSTSSSGIQWGVNSDVSKILLTFPETFDRSHFSVSVRNQESINHVPMQDTTVIVGLVSVRENELRLPKAFGLEQNYPNPFNPSTVIRYRLSVSGPVTLKVFNVLGQEVATLANEVKQAGRQEVMWDASGFPSGVYFYRLMTPIVTATRKLLLLR